MATKCRWCAHGRYLRLVAKVVLSNDTPDFEPVLRSLRAHGGHFKRAGELSRGRIAALGDRFIQEDSVVLVHGYSRSVMTLLLNASKRKHFDVYVLEGRPGEHGFKVCKELSAAGVPVTVAPDSVCLPLSPSFRRLVLLLFCLCLRVCLPAFVHLGFPR
jgi:translation initiation factor eIF-2B subunit alpha